MVVSEDCVASSESVREGLTRKQLMRGGQEELRWGSKRVLVRGQTNSYGGQKRVGGGISGLVQGAYNTAPPAAYTSFARGAK